MLVRCTRIWLGGSSETRDSPAVTRSGLLHGSTCLKEKQQASLTWREHPAYTVPDMMWDPSLGLCAGVQRHFRGEDGGLAALVAQSGEVLRI